MNTDSRARVLRFGAIVAAAFAAVLWAGGYAMSEEPAKGGAAKEAPAAEKSAGAAATEGPKESDEEAQWPCEQKFVAEISPATIWTGPPLDEAMKSWHQNESLREIVTYATDETTEDADGVKAIDEFAAKLTGDKGKVLTQLFAALFETMNDKRTSYQDGIKKYFRRQEAMAQKVNKIQADLRALDKKGAKPDDSRRVELKKDVAWNNRVYDERQKLVPYVCEIPVLLEQKLGAYARAIQGHMAQ
jgi:hypothetical protein